MLDVLYPEPRPDAEANYDDSEFDIAPEVGPEVNVVGIIQSPGLNLITERLNVDGGLGLLNMLPNPGDCIAVYQTALLLLGVYATKKLLQFLMPHKDKAMFDIDTFIAYEPAVYKPIILDELLEARNTYPEYEPFKDLEEFLTEIEGMDMDLVPANSLVREFVGGSHYDY